MEPGKEAPSETAEPYHQIDPKKERRLLLKLDAVILPMTVLLYLSANLDVSVSAFPCTHVSVATLATLVCKDCKRNYSMARTIDTLWFCSVSTLPTCSAVSPVHCCPRLYLPIMRLVEVASYGESSEHPS